MEDESCYHLIEMGVDRSLTSVKATMNVQEVQLPNSVT